MNPSDNYNSPAKIDDFNNVENCPVIFIEKLPTTGFAATIVFSVVNILSSFTAATANFLVLWAIKKTPSLHTPSSVPLFILALSDFTTGVFVQPVLFVSQLGALTKNFSVLCISGAISLPFGSFLIFVSFWQITAISFDRCLALILHLRYAVIITVRRVIKFNLLVFVLLFPVAIYFWFSREEWFRNTVIGLAITIGAIGVITILFSYWKIFAILRRHQKQIQNQSNIATRMHGISHMDISKYRRSVLTILYIVSAILLSYLPCGVSHMFKFLFNNKTNAIEFAQSVGGMMVLVNSSINPLVYCWRIKEIRRFVMSKLRRVFGVSDLPDRAVRVIRVRPVNIPSHRETPV